MKKNTIFICLSLLLLSFILLMFGNYCPLEEIIGIPCPGCGLFTATYWLLKGNLQLAIYFNPTIIFFIPYILVMLMLLIYYKKEFVKNNYVKKITYIFVFIMTIIYTYRMFIVFPDFPMEINKNSLFFKIKSIF